MVQRLVQAHSPVYSTYHLIDIEIPRTCFDQHIDYNMASERNTEIVKPDADEVETLDEVVRYCF